MRLALHTVVCCCVFTMVLPLRRDELNSSLKKRFKIWLQSRMKRDPSSSVLAASGVHIGAQQGEKAIIPSPAPSFGLNVRPKRSTSTKSGCNLPTCVYHDLLHDLYVMNNNLPKEAKAPPDKMKPTGYGRRRRSLLDVPQSSEAGGHVCRHKRTCAVA